MPYKDYLAQEDSVPAMKGVTATSRVGYEPSAAENIERIYGEASRQQAAGPPGRGRTISPEEAAVPGYFDALGPNLREIGSAISALPRSDLGASWLGGRDAPAPRTATGRAATPDAAVPPTQRRATDISPSSEAMGPNIPGGGRPSAVDGIFRRDGAGGVPEFYNLGPGGQAPKPLSARGNLSVIGTGLSPEEQQRYAEIKARDAARRSGGGGGGGGSPVMDRAMGALEQAAALRDRARHYTGISRMSERNALLMQAEALEGSANSMMSAGASMQNARLGADVARERNQLAGELASSEAAQKVAEANRPMTAMERAELANLQARTGETTAQMLERMRALSTPELQSLMPGVDVDADQMALLQMTGGQEALQQGLSQAQARARLAQEFGPEQVQRFLALSPEERAEVPGLNEMLGAAGLIQNYAEGGYVDDMDDIDVLGPELGMDGMDPMSAMGMGGAGAMGMGMQEDPMQMEYDQYAQVAEQMGLPVIPFEAFVQIMMQSQEQAAMEANPVESFAGGGAVEPRNQFGYATDPATGRSPVGAAAWGRNRSAMESFNKGNQDNSAAVQAFGDALSAFGQTNRNTPTASQPTKPRPSAASMFANQGQDFIGSGSSMERFAQGGPVPVGGKMVFDPENPNAATDTIPAVIDGERPAALKSGEFVWPDDVVRFYGTDKLNKMMEAARKGPEDATVAR